MSVQFHSIFAFLIVPCKIKYVPDGVQVFGVWIPSKELKKRGLYIAAQGYHV
jgi:hypothetical protein